jgi:hypothetical protein
VPRKQRQWRPKYRGRFPSALGDNYEKVIESLSRPADAGLTLNIADRNPDPQQN